LAAFIGRRILQLIPVLFGVSVVVFVMVRAIPGDPAQALLGQTATPDQIAEVRNRLGLDEPVFTQYLLFIKGALTGDFGTSLAFGQPVTSVLLERFPATLELTLAALLFAVIVGVPVGVIAAVKQYSLVDKITSVIALAGVSMPVFWLALVLVVLFTVQIDILPFPGRVSSDTSFTSYTGLYVVDTIVTFNLPALWDVLRHLILPAIALGTIPMAVITRMTRSSMLEVMGEDYVRTARAKGVVPWQVVFRHALRNAMLPTVTVIGLQFGLLMSGAVLTETIFGWPGIGQAALDSVNRRDYALIQGVVLYGATFFVLVNLLVDVLYAVLDPRVRY
jgi:peptide/nickel transport system permease protein